MVPAPISEMLSEAREKRYAVGYFESWNLESTRAVIAAANEERSPVIIGFNGTIVDEHRRDLEYYAAIGKVAARKAQVPVGLILNEASGFEQIILGIRYGFPTVMIDGSSMTFENNVRLTRKVVDVAHSANVSVEGQSDELPHSKAGILPEKDIKTNMTDPKKAQDFVNRTGVDALSVSVGNVHVLYKEYAEIDFERLEEIAKAVDIPLVLHGATGIKDDSIKKAIELGICKINLGTALRLTFTVGIRNALGVRSLAEPEGVLELAEFELKEFVKTKMRVYGSSGKVKTIG